MMKIQLIKSPRWDKKWRVVFEDGSGVNFGQKGYSDFTIHKDPMRMKRYLKRHARMGETWGKSGIKTAGFWSRWLLWSKPDLNSAVRFVNNKFNVKIIR